MLEKIKEIARIGKTDDTKRLIDIEDKLWYIINLKHNLIMTCVIKITIILSSTFLSSIKDKQKLSIA